MKRLVAFAVAAALCLTGGAAQARQAPASAAASHASPQTKALAERYFIAIHYDKLLDQMMTQMTPVMISAMRKQKPSLTDEDGRIISEIVVESTRDMTAKMKAPMIEAMAEVFTEQELRDLVTFYEGPTGQALVAKTPELTQRMMAQMPTLMADMQGKMMEKLCARVACDKSGAPVAGALKP